MIFRGSRTEALVAIEPRPIPVVALTGVATFDPDELKSREPRIAYGHYENDYDSPPSVPSLKPKNNWYRVRIIHTVLDGVDSYDTVLEISYLNPAEHGRTDGLWHTEDDEKRRSFNNPAAAIEYANQLLDRIDASRGPTEVMEFFA